MKLTLYVKGKKTPIVTEELRYNRGQATRYSLGWRQTPSGEPTGLGDVIDLEPNHQITYKSILPEEQKRLVDLMEKLAKTIDFELEVIDVAEEFAIHRELDEKIRRITIYPTLITDNGKKIQGEITEEQIRALIERSKNEDNH